MSFTITAQAIPSVATSDWETVNQHLLRRKGDWVILRTGLLHLVCERVTREGDPVTRLEEYLLLEFYREPTVYAGFLDALQRVRAELASWPVEVSNLIEHLLAENPDFSACAKPFPLEFNRLRVAARRAGSAPEAPKRDLNRFRKSRQNTDSNLPEVSQ